MLSEFGRNIWICDGPEVSVLGFRYPTRMAVIQMAQGLFIWSPVALTPALQQAVNALGTVRWIVAPNHLHHLFLSDWHTAYPDAELWAAPKLAAKRRDLSFDGTLSATPLPAWAPEIDQTIVQGNAITTEVVFFHRPSGTTLFTDLLQQFPQGHHRGWRGVIAKLDKMVEPEPAVPRKFRVAFTNRKAARASLSRILDWPTQYVLMAHGTPVTQNGQAFLKSAFAWLAP